MHTAAEFLSQPYDEAFRMAPVQLREFQLAAANEAFKRDVTRIPVLGRLARKQGVRSIGSVAELARVLFPHTLYKSYSMHLIEAGDWSGMCRWLSALSAVDVSRTDMSGVASIDAWIERLDTATPIRLAHTFGTSGKLSFFPRIAEEWARGSTVVSRCVEDWHGRSTGPRLIGCGMPLIQPGSEFGFGTPFRVVAEMIRNYGIDRRSSLFLYPGDRTSADVAVLAGRLRSAAAVGGDGELAVSAALQSKLDEFAAIESSRRKQREEFLVSAPERFGGRDVLIFAVWPVLFRWAEDAMRRGQSAVFGRGSVLLTGGGTKGASLPSDWRRTVFEFLGFDKCLESYAMTEVVANSPRCEHGNYHLPPVTVPILLHPDSGEVIDFDDRATGRLGLLDLLALNSWGGIVTSDLVTIGGGNATCACGRQGFFVEPDIVRLGAHEGGDDKISCAGVADAYDDAIAHLSRLSA